MKATVRVRRRRHAARHDRRLPRRHAAARRAEEALREETRMLELLNATGTLLAVEARPADACVQAVTDAATELSGAKFGAFFYNVTDDDGESLHALHAVGRAARGVRASSASRAQHAAVRADLPRRRRRSASTTSRRIRATARWRRTTACRPATCRCAATWRCRCGSRSGEVIGGLFFGHPTPACSPSAPSGSSSASRRRPASPSTTRGCTRRRSSAAEERKALLESERAARAEAERMSDDEGRVPGHAVARAAHAAQRHPRLVADAAQHGAASAERAAARASRPSSATRACRRS